MNVFDDIARVRHDTPHQDESQYPYLNLSARPEAEHVRKLIEDWLELYPEAHRTALIARLRSPIDDEHRSAFFELFLHRLVCVRGLHVLEIEPALPHTSNRPDFLIETPTRQRFYLEAVLATGRSQAESAAQRRLNQALRAIDTFPSSNHFLDLHVTGTPSQPVTIRKLKAALATWVANLLEGERGKTPFAYEEHGLRVRLDAWPKNTPRDSRAIGVRHFPVQQVTVDEDIRSAVEKKARRYGRLDLPYIVAVNTLGIFQEMSSVMDALFGTEYTAAYQKADGTYVHEDRRQPDGVWFGAKGPQRRGVSAVLAAREVTPWNFASRAARLVHNPWASRPLPELSLGIDEFRPTDGVLRKAAGHTLGKLLGLPDGWPVDGI